MPVGQPDQLRLIYWRTDKGTGGVNQINSSGTRDPRTGADYGSNYNYPVFRAFQDAGRTLGYGDIAAFTFLRQANVTLEDEPIAAAGMLVSGNYFAGMRVPMTLGRGLVESDDQEGAPPAVVISNGLWRRGYGADPAAIGRTIGINGQAFTLVGVTAPGYFGVSSGGFFPPADVTATLHAQPLVSPRWTPAGGSLFSGERTFWLHVIARIPPGESDARLRDALAATFAQHPSTTALGIVSPEIAVLPGAAVLDSFSRTFETPIRILAGVAGLVFLIACVNVAALVLARGLARRREFWIRLALGAGRGRLVREALTESLLLAAAGGLAGVALCLWCTPALVAILARCAAERDRRAARLCRSR